MRRSFTHILAFIQLTRLALVFTAISNIWFVTLWSRLVENRNLPQPLALWEHLLLTGGVAVGLYIFGMTLNDIFDARRDKVFNPHRPLVAKRFTMSSAMVIAIGGLLMGILCAVGLGVANTLFALACAALIVLYNASLKYMPAVGLLTLGMIRAVHMFIADPRLEFTWPVWLIFTHILVISALGHRLERKRPYLSQPELWVLSAGWVFWSLGIILWMVQRNVTPSPVPWVWIGPIVAGLVFLGMIVTILHNVQDGRIAGQAIMRLGLIWLIVFDGIWFAAAGNWPVMFLFMGLLIASFSAVRLTRAMQIYVDDHQRYQSDRRE